MKKTVSLILAVVLMLSVFSFGVFAADTKTETLFDTVEETKEVSVTFRTGFGDKFGQSYSVVNTVHMKGEDIAYDFDNGFFKLRTLADDGKLVSFLPVFPFIHMTVVELPFVNVDVWGIIKKVSDFTMDFLVFVKSYETVIDGVTYYVEEFSDRGSVINSFYYVGDDLKVLKAQDFAKKTIQYTYFDDVSLSVDKAVFERPAFSIELTAVLSFLLMIFGGMPMPVV